MNLNQQNLKETLIKEITDTIQREYIYYEVLNAGEIQQIGKSNFISAPKKGEFILFHIDEKTIYSFEVVNVAHSQINDYPGYIYVKKANSLH